jgi:hypothetical protein
LLSLLLLGWIYRFVRPARELNSLAFRPEISRAEYRELKRTLAEVQRANDGPDDEVIRSFNVSLELMERLNFERPPGMPVEDYIKQYTVLSEGRLWSPFEKTAHVFSRVLYGQEAASPGEVKGVRQNTREIFQAAKRFVRSSRSA